MSCKFQAESLKARVQSLVELKFKSASSNPRVTSSNPRVKSSNPRVMSSNPRVMSSNPQVIESMKTQVNSLKSSSFLKIISPKLFSNS